MSDVKIQPSSSAASSMPNIAVMSGANDDVLEIQSLTSASMQLTSDGPEVARDEFAGPPKRLWCSMPNIYMEFDANNTTESECISMMQVLTNAENGSIKPTLDDPITDLNTVADELTAVISGANEVLEIQFSTSAPMQKISGGPVVLDMAREEFASLPKKSWYSMPNIHLEFDANNTTKSKCIPMMQALKKAENGSVKPTQDDSITDLSKVADEEFTATTVEKGLRRRSLWKRTKKFVRRMFCCA
ncbi:unnamed protein product [Aphis gossypii]|uniref:Uncharacterized protein n=1 Tax=Aphis gossypii TaxID=80765 RepID=A0A9P0JFI4_APHGO|nr:unnamed protein product [Aphis gossypii]